MKLVMRLFGALIGLVVLLAAIGLFLPRVATVQRSIHINAPRATVFALVDSFRFFNAYSPWVDIDPDTRYTFEGPTEGVGAAMEWHSNDANVGSGRQEIVAADPGKRVAIALKFSGMRGAESEFLLSDGKDGGTDITWQLRMDSGYNLISRYFGLFLDGMVGPDYVKGLKRLAIFAEGYPALDLAGFEPRQFTLAATPIIYTGSRTTMEPDAMQASMRAAFGALDSFLALNEMNALGGAVVITRSWNEKEGTWTFEAAYPVAVNAPADRFAPGIKRGELPATDALEVTLQGADWNESSTTYEKLDLYMKLHGLVKNGDSWEAYDSNPLTTPPEQLVTHIVMPVKNKPIN